MWKDIQNTNGFYSVSDDGMVKSNDRVVYNKGSNTTNNIKGKVLNQYVNNKGYKYVDICINGKSKHYLVHRLVADAFIENPNNFPLINHIDCNPLNNRADNLEWCDYSYNIQYCGKVGRRNDYSEACLKARTAPSVWLYKHVAQYDLDGRFIRNFESLTSATQWLVQEGKTKNKNAKSNIFACCKGLSKSAYGYIWKYTE